ncbi:MAG: hypothetical protein ACYC2R_04005 [Burkholderiales bacterium]
MKWVASKLKIVEAFFKVFYIVCGGSSIFMAISRNILGLMTP